MAEATYQHSSRSTASVDEVWERLQEPSTWATVAGVDSTSDHTRDETGLTGFGFSTSIGGIAYRGNATVAEARRGESMTLAITSNELTGSITVELEPGRNDTGLTVTMKMRPKGFVGTMVFPLVTAAVRSGFAESVDRLATSVG